MQTYTLLEFESLASTNDFLKENHSYFPHMTFIRANHQDKGRGQFDRLWSSKAYENMTFSIMLKDIEIEKLAHVKAWVTDAVLAFLNQIGIEASFKEPNDLYVQQKKIAGILIETQLLEESFDYVIIGVGLNVNQTSFEGFQATSIALESDVVKDIESLFRSLLEFMVLLYPRYQI